MSRAALACRTFLVLLAPASAPLALQERRHAPEPLVVHALSDPAAFSGRETLVDFELFAPGTPLSTQLAAAGVLFERAEGFYPAVWSDLLPRSSGPGGSGALNNFLADAPGPHPRDPALPADAAVLRLRFLVPVHRAGFELRCEGALRRNALVTCLRRGRPLETRFFDVESGYRFLGLESTRPFDELVLAFTNPERGAFSLDDLRFETDRRDGDRDGVPDFADLCPGLFDPEQLDADGDSQGDGCDPFPADARNDEDGDGLGAELDNCPEVYNPDQADRDRDRIGDPCDTALGSDQDGDGVPDGADNCPETANPEQTDCDADGVGDVCDDTLIEPQEVDLALGRGQSLTLSKRICLPPTPPQVDILMAVDTTGSMGGEIAAMRQNLVAFVLRVRELAPDSDIRLGLVSYRDYPASYSSCGYNNTYGYTSYGDYPFRVEAPIGSPDVAVLDAVRALTANGGADGPESYTRVLWEVTQPDSGIGFRPGARRVLLNVCDDMPHDCDPDEGLPAGCLFSTTGLDPGRDALVFTPDDLDFQDDSLLPLAARRTRMFTIYSNPYGICAWREWSEGLGGTLIQANSSGGLPPGTDVAEIVLELIADPFVERVTFEPDDCALDVAFDPPEIVGPIDITLGAQVFTEETITVPADLPEGVDSVDCNVRIRADGVLIGIQRIHVDVACATLAFEGPPNGMRIVGTEFSEQVVISSAGANLGVAVFDSDVGGPNDPPINEDMLLNKGNMLLLQHSAYPDQTVPGVFDTVTDDEDGGDLIFDFVLPVDPRSVLLADINPPPNQGASVTLLDFGGRTRVYTVEPGWTGGYGDAGPWQLDLTTLLPQPGNGTPRLATAVEDPGFEQDGVVRIVVHMTGYGAMDELVYCPSE